MLARVSVFATRLTRPTALVAVGVGVAAGLARLPRALTDPLWQDEVASARILREPTVGRMLSQVGRTESTPPLWYTLGWLAHHAGVSIHDVRLLSVGLGATLAGTVVLLARRVVNLTYAALAGILVALGGQFVAHGRELRAYELFGLLTVLFAMALEAEVQSPSFSRECRLCLCTAAGSLTHYFFFFTIIAGLVWLFAEPSAIHVRRRTATAIVAGLILCLPWFPILIRQYRQHRFSWIGGFNIETVVNTPLRLFTPLPHPGSYATAVGSIVLCVVLAGAIVLGAHSPRGRLYASLALVPLALASIGWAAGFPIYSVRNMIGIGGFVAVSLAASVGALPAPARHRIAVLLACGLAAIFAYDQQLPDAPYNQMAHALVAEGWKTVDPVAVPGNISAFRSPLEWYLPKFPVLAAVAAARATCGTLYAIDGLEAAKHLLAYVTARQNVGGFVVLRLRSRARELFGGDRILAATQAEQCDA